jgi:hypothetical protein
MVKKQALRRVEAPWKAAVSGSGRDSLYVLNKAAIDKVEIAKPKPPKPLTWEYLYQINPGGPTKYKVEAEGPKQIKVCRVTKYRDDGNPIPTVVGMFEEGTEIQSGHTEHWDKECVDAGGRIVSSLRRALIESAARAEANIETLNQKLETAKKTHARLLKAISAYKGD